MDYPIAAENAPEARKEIPEDQTINDTENSKTTTYKENSRFQFDDLTREPLNYKDSIKISDDLDTYKVDNEIMLKSNIERHNLISASNMTKLEKDKRRLSKQMKVTSRTANSLFLLLRIMLDLQVVMKSVVLCVLCTSVCALKEQRFAIEPQDQTAVVGSRVTLPCRVVNKAGQLQWTKDDFGLGTHRHLTGYERYKMIGSDEEGDYSLDIREVTLEDDALYQCQVSSGPRGEPPIRSRYARLLVLVPPDPPKILQGPELEAIEDREVNLECVSVGGKPASEITWVDNDGGVLTQGVTYTVEQLNSGRFTARSILRLRPRRHHHNQTFTCQAQNTADRAYRAVSVKLMVQFAPKVRMLIKTGVLNGKIQEGDTVAVGCQAHANPNNLTYKWYINNDAIVGSAGNEMIITNVTRKYNEATVKCEVYNTVGKSADTKTLEVTYGPTFKVRPHNVEAEHGSPATLTCIVDGHPQPKIMWLRYDNDRVVRVGKSSNLTVTVTQQTAGQYWCRGSSVENHQDIEASATVYVRGSPKILSNHTQYGVEGDIVRIECVSFSVPKPDYVMWTFGGHEINSFHNQEYAFLEETLTDGMMKSTLIIRESQARHFGTYNCSVSNLYGTDSVEIRLVPDKTFPLILIISACSSAAVLVLIVMLIIMLCHRKTRQSDVKKPDITNIVKTADHFKDSDRNSNISDLKMELRHVEGSCDMDHSNGGSETELHSTLHLTTNLGLPLAGPVPLPDAGYDNELMKQYQRYSGDFNQPINNLHFKVQGQSNGYVPYVDYTRDYVPPGDSLTGSLTRSTNSTFPSHCGSLNRQTSCGRLTGLVGPDVIPMANPGVVLAGGVDVRYAATYGNPYLRGSGPLAFMSQGSQSNSGTKAAPPPPYYSIKSSNLTLPVVTSGTSPSSSSSSRHVTSPLPSSSSTQSGAQPQVPKSSPSAGALYVLPPSSQGSLQSNQITAKGSGSQLKPGTHV